MDLINLKKLLLKCSAFLKPILKLLFSLFYSPAYLKGKHFDTGYGGYFYAIRSIWQRNILRLAPTFPWPMGLTCYVSSYKNITFHIDDLNNFHSPGTYFQNFNGHIYIGKGSFIGPNVGIITSNHSLQDLDKHDQGRDVTLGEECWIGMNSVILPGVVLGPKTIVAAGSVVTKSFNSGYIVIAGSPAQIIKENR